MVRINNLKNEQDSKYYDSDNNDVASTTECTGLISTPPENNEESEAYKEIYKVPKQGQLNNIKKQKN